MIRFINVTKSFGTNKILDDISFIIPRGKISFIMGRSGEGKTVIFKLMMGLLKPDQGHIIIDNEDITDFGNDKLYEVRKKFGILFQGAALFDNMNIEDNIMFPLHEHSHLSEEQINSRAKNVLKDLEIDRLTNKYPYQLTTSEKKRVGLARALVGLPKILLYDEPTTGTDAFVSEIIDHLMIKIAKENQDLTSVIISHDTKEALSCADWIFFLYKGKIEKYGTADEFRKTKDPFIRQFFSGKTVGPMEAL